LSKSAFKRAAAFLLLSGASLLAQFTLVSGTVKDPNNLPYAFGTISAQLASSSSPVFTLTGLSYAVPTQAVGLDKNGKFLLRLADNTALSPGGSQYSFTVCSGAGTVSPSVGTGSQCFTTGLLTISGATQDISTAINALALALTLSGAGGITGATAGGGLVVNGTTLGNRVDCGNNQVLQWNGAAWVCSSVSAGTVTGSGAVGYYPKFSGSSTNIAQSLFGDGSTLNQCTISAISRTANLVTVTCQGGSGAWIPSGSPMSISGVADSSFNTGVGVSVTPITDTGAQYTYTQVGANASSSGGSVQPYIGPAGASITVAPVISTNSNPVAFFATPGDVSAQSVGFDFRVGASTGNGSPGGNFNVYAGDSNGNANAGGINLFAGKALGSGTSGTVNIAKGSLQVANITGSTQCVSASSTGVLSGTGAPCGTSTPSSLASGSALTGQVVQAVNGSNTIFASLGVGTRAAVTGATDAINCDSATSAQETASDRGAVIPYNRGTAIAVTVPQAGSAGCGNGFNFLTYNIGAGVVTFTPTTSTITLITPFSITAGLTTLALQQGGDAFWTVDTSNNYVVHITNNGSIVPATVLPAIISPLTTDGGLYATGTGAGTTQIGSVSNPLRIPQQTAGITDVCAVANTQIAAGAAYGGTIDMRGVVPQGTNAICGTNMFANSNKPYTVWLGNYNLVLCVPQITPQIGGHWIGVAQMNSVYGGTVIRTGTAAECTAAGFGGAFPNSTSQIVTTWQHGPFPAGTRTALINSGGNVSTGAPAGLNDAFNFTLKYLTLDCSDGAGNDVANFGYFTSNDEENSGLYELTIRNCISAGAFWDRQFNNGGGSGPTHMNADTLQITNNHQSCTSGLPGSGTCPNPSYGIVFEGHTSFISFDGGTCTQLPTAYTITMSGIPTAPVLTSGGNCSVLPTGCTLHVSGSGSGNVCATSGSGSAITSISFSAAGSGYATTTSPGGGARFQNFTTRGFDSTHKIVDGVWSEGDYDPTVVGVHAENTLDAAVRHGAGTARMFVICSIWIPATRARVK